jgi:hypothetical protein
LPSVEMAAVNEWVASLTCCHDQAVLKRCGIECLRFLLTTSMASTCATVISRMTSRAIIHVVVCRCR